MTSLIDRIGLKMFIQIVVESWNELILLMLISTMLIGVKRDKSNKLTRKLDIPFTNELIIFFFAAFLYNLFDIADIVFGAMPNKISFYVIRTGVFCYYAVGGFQTIFLLQVIQNHIAEKLDIPRLKKMIFAFQLLQIPLLILLVITPFTDSLYYINERNEYVRSWGYNIWQVVTIITFIFIGCVIVSLWRRIDGFFKVIILIGAVFPIIGLIGGFYIDMSLNNIMVAVSALLMFLVYERNKTEVTISNTYELERTKTTLAESKAELERGKLTLLMAQIKPHFINNAMTAIKELCYEDPDSAAELLDHFARYLRSYAVGVDKDLVSIEWELQAIKEYLAIEFADKDKKFSFDFNVGPCDFSVPALSIEPLAENAVKHGIDRYSEKSRIVLSVYETSEYNCVEIKDNGKGFEPNDETLGKGGIGLSNAVRRLKIMCGGSMAVERKDGWTVVMIKIPKDRHENDRSVI